MRAMIFILTLALLGGCTGPVAREPSAVTAQKGAAPGGESRDLPLLQVWSGDYPLAELYRLPVGQRQTPVGWLGDAEAFAALWGAFQPGVDVPEVDF